MAIEDVVEVKVKLPGPYTGLSLAEEADRDPEFRWSYRVEDSVFAINPESGDIERWSHAAQWLSNKFLVPRVIVIDDAAYIGVSVPRRGHNA